MLGSFEHFVVQKKRKIENLSNNENTSRNKFYSKIPKLNVRQLKKNSCNI